jgi:hypothetical protein
MKKIVIEAESAGAGQQEVEVSDAEDHGLFLLAEGVAGVDDEKRHDHREKQGHEGRAREKAEDQQSRAEQFRENGHRQGRFGAEAEGVGKLDLTAREQLVELAQAVREEHRAAEGEAHGQEAEVLVDGRRRKEAAIFHVKRFTLIA